MGCVRFLTDADVRTATPRLTELVDLAEEGLVALAQGRAEVPPKPAVHTSPTMFANAMPAAYPQRNLLGCKWISLVPDNPTRGLPTANGLMVVNDGTTGVPVCVMAAGELTAVRTAAVTGACVRRLARTGPVTFLGAGVQARSHLRVLSALGVPEVRVWARRRAALDELVRDAAHQAPALTIIPMNSAQAAVREATVVISGLTIGLTQTRLSPSWLAPQALLLPLDYASSVGPDIAEAADMLATDDVVQFQAVRAERAKLGDYPTPTTWTGHALTGPRPDGLVVVVNLGSAIGDLLVGDAIATRAADLGLGTVLPGT